MHVTEVIESGRKSGWRRLVATICQPLEVSAGPA
jgi:hypothetical protein